MHYHWHSKFLHIEVVLLPAVQLVVSQLGPTRSDDATVAVLIACTLWQNASMCSTYSSSWQSHDAKCTCKALVILPGFKALMISSWRKSLILPQSPGMGAFSEASNRHHFSHSSLFFSMSLARVMYDCSTDCHFSVCLPQVRVMCNQQHCIQASRCSTTQPC